MRKISILVLTFILLMAILPVGSASAKVMWGKTELKNGQIGKITVLKNTQLWQYGKDKKSLVEVRNLKKGEEYRVYTYKGDFGGVYGVGGSSFIKKSSSIKYETPSKVKLQALGVNIAERTYKGEIKYPEVTNLVNKGAQDKINNTIKKHIEKSYAGSIALKEAKQAERQAYINEHGHEVPKDQEYSFSYKYTVTYDVKYNKDNLLSVLIYDYIYTGGAHGMSSVNTYNFDVLTGNQVSLNSVTKSSTARSKIKDYVKKDLQNQNAKIGMIFEHQLNDISIDNNRPFYFYDNGIAVKFYEYEVAAYAAGMPESKVPYSVFR